MKGFETPRIGVLGNLSNFFVEKDKEAIHIYIPSITIGKNIERQVCVSFFFDGMGFSVSSVSTIGTVYFLKLGI